MGYTHYWQRDAALPSAPFARAVTDCRRICCAFQLPLAGSHGDGDPIFDADAVVFNGRGPESHETFAIHRTESPRRPGQKVFSFCKTARKPYDLAVQLALIIFAHHLSIEVSSDGDMRDWQRAKVLCQEHLGYGEEFQLAGS